MKHRFLFFPAKKKRRKKNASERRREKKEDQIVFIGTYFTHYFEKKKKETHTHKHYYNVREIGRTSHRDRFGYHVLVRRRVVSTNNRLFFSVLESPDASSSIDFVVGRRFLRLMMMWRFVLERSKETIEKRKGVDDRKRGRSGASPRFSSRDDVVPRKSCECPRRVRRTPKPSPSRTPAEDDGRKRSF